MVLISITLEQAGTLHYFSTLIKSGMVHSDLIFIFSQASKVKVKSSLLVTAKDKKSVT